MEEEYPILNTSISNDGKKTKYIIKNKTKSRELNNIGTKKLKYLIREFCINNSKLNNNKNKFIKKTEEKNNKNYINNSVTKRKEKKPLKINDNNKEKISKNNNEIFEIMSDIKVKSYNEYEQEQEQKSIQKTEPKNKSQINNNININININYNTINVNKTNPVNGDFIEDRDEYNNNLKESFSKDRFSFRPINNEVIMDNERYNNIIKNKKLDKMDFIPKEQVKNENEKKIINNMEKNKCANGKIKKSTGNVKNNAGSKINKTTTSLNKSINIKRKKKK